MKAVLTGILLLAVALPAAAQGVRERAVKRCQDNRGTDCQSEQGLRIWMQEELPMTEQQRQNAAGAANARRRAEEARQQRVERQPKPPQK